MHINVHAYVVIYKSGHVTQLVVGHVVMNGCTEQRGVYRVGQKSDTSRTM